MTSILLVAIVVVPCTCVTLVIMLGMVLRFARELVNKNNGDTRCLRDVAVLLRAFRAGPNGALTSLVKILKRS